MTKSAVGDSLGAVGVSQPLHQNEQPAKRCWACGGPSHGLRNDRKTRAKHCEAWTFKCVKCTVKGHFSSCCSKCVNCNVWGHRDSSSRNCPKSKNTKHQTYKTRDNSSSNKDKNVNDFGYVYDQLCSVSEDNTCEDLIIATDHKPLLQILNDRSLTDIANRRLLNLKEKTLGYRFTVVHVPGKKNLGADAASRYPTGNPERLKLPGDPAELQSLKDEPISLHDVLTSLYQQTDDNDDADDDSTLAAAYSTLHSVCTVVTWDMLREATTSDPTLRTLVQCIEHGFPEDVRDLPPELRAYHRLSPSMCVVDGVVLVGHRVVIPAVLRESVLNALHAAHQGVSAMQARAVDSVYWPDITVDIARIRDQCLHCHKIAKSNPMQPPSDIEPPEFPFQQICADYFTYNNTDYVVIVDRYSNWPMVYRSESGAEGLVKRLRETFVTFGIPEELTSDGGPQFTAGKTQEFLRNWGVRHRLCLVANPHANSRAELAVKNC